MYSQQKPYNTHQKLKKKKKIKIPFLFFSAPPFVLPGLDGKSALSTNKTRTSHLPQPNLFLDFCLKEHKLINTAKTVIGFGMLLLSFHQRKQDSIF